MKINILKDKVNNKRVGSFSSGCSQIIILKINGCYSPKSTSLLIKFLKDNFNIVTLNQNCNKNSRGSISGLYEKKIKRIINGT